MGWFDEQINVRKKKDDEALEDALEEISATLLHQKRKRSADEKAQNAFQDILRFYHKKPKKTEDLTIQLDAFCRTYGFMHRRVILDKGWYKDATGAMLGTKKNGDRVALIPYGLFGYCFYDDTIGKKRIVNAHNEDLLEEEAVCFYEIFPQHKMGIRDLMKYIYGCLPKRMIELLLVMMAILTLLGMFSTKLTHILFSEVIASGNYTLLGALAVLSVCVMISSLLFQSFRSLIMNRINTTVEISIQAATMARILSLPTGFFKKYSAGELSSRSQYIESLCSMLISMVMMSGLTSLFSLSFMVQIFQYTPALLSPALCMIGVTLVFTIVSSLMMMKENRAQMQAAAKKDGMSYAMISGIQKIKLSGAEKRTFSKWLYLFNEEVKHTYGIPNILILSHVISLGISLTGTIILYYFAVVSHVSAADYYAFTAAFGFVSGAFINAIDIALSSARIQPVLEMAKPILEAVPETQEKEEVTQLSGAIEINHVSFRYGENMPYVLQDISLKIKPKEYVALVGKSGCGKTTLMRLLMGFVIPEKGAIYFDGKDVNSLNLQTLRKCMGTVMQDGKLFHGDIYSNIIISAPELTLDDAWEAAEKADIAEDIKAMPMGMHTMIQEHGGGLSQGQKQRLMIARAIAPKPKILIFDEATSALDNMTQKKVSESLDRLHCTRIIIAHRLSTIKNCDRILVLDQGKIIEEGTYDELMKKKGFFEELVQRQRLDVID